MDKINVIEMINSEDKKVREYAIKYLRDFMDHYREVDMITVKTNIRRLRKERLMRIKQVAELAGMSEGVYINLENKSYKYKPTLEMLIKLANVHNCSLYEFIKPIE